MTNRREFLIGAGALALAARAARASALDPPSAWPPYRDALAIDGATGFSMLQFEDVDAATAARQLAAARDCGLSGMLKQVTQAGLYGLRETAFEETKKRIAFCKRQIDAHADTFLLVGGGQDLERARRERRLGVILHFQGSEPLGTNTERVPLFRELGVRVIQLTHNLRNLVGDGCLEPGNAGLSNLGRDVVERLNQERVVVDLAHGAQRTIKEGIEASKAPVLISHTGCRALADLPRNVGDVELRAMADRGGVAGIMFWPYLRTEGQPMGVDVVRHIEHAIKVCGEDHVGIGTDGGIEAVERTPEFERQNLEINRDTVAMGLFGKDRNPEGLYMFIPDLNMPNRFEVLGGMLSARGHSDARIAKILGGNFARVMGEVWG